MVSASLLFKGNGGGVCYFAFFQGKFYIKGTDDNLMIIRDDYLRGDLSYPSHKNFSFQMNRISSSSSVHLYQPLCI